MKAESYQDLPISYKRHLIVQTLMAQKLCQAFAIESNKPYELLGAVFSMAAKSEVAAMSDRDIEQIVESFNKAVQRYESANLNDAFVP